MAAAECTKAARMESSAQEDRPHPNQDSSAHVNKKVMKDSVLRFFERRG